MGDQTKAGYDALANNGGFEQSRDYYESVLSGDKMSPDNPHLKNLQNSVLSSVMPSVNSTFSRSGMTGSSAHQGVLTRSITDGMAQPLFNLHENERQRQERAAGVLPQLYGQNAAAQIQAGSAYDQDRQNQINADRQAWEDERLAPIRGTMDVLPSLIGLGNVGGTSSGTTTQTQQQSPWQTAAGLGSMAAGAAMNFAMPGSGMMLSSMGGAMGGGGLFGGGQSMGHPYMAMR